MRTYLYLNGERVAVNNLYNSNHGQYYYGSDILGSITLLTGEHGQEIKRIGYDIFGGIYKGYSPLGLETGYTGKPYDAVTGLSDYGFRDYAPSHARFITEDPIRDGDNWFSYVGNNPVNWVDPDGRLAIPVPPLAIPIIGYIGYKYATDAQLREDTGELIKAGVKATVDTVKWTGKTVAKGAQWAGKKISEGVSAVSGYFSKGRKVRDKEGNVIPPGNQNNQERQGNELRAEKPEIPDPSKLGEPGYIPPGGGNNGGWKKNAIVVGFVLVLHNHIKETFPPVPSAPPPASPPGKQTPEMASYRHAENVSNSNNQNTTSLKGK